MPDCRTLQEVRQNIDRLDRAIVALLVERTDYVRQAARFKPERSQIVVPERIEEIIDTVRRIGLDMGADAELLEDIYRGMIAAFIRHEGVIWDKMKSGG